MNNSSTIIVIPARGNSKGIKKKNLIKFCGKPLLYWTIFKLKNQNLKNIYFQEDEKILKFSRKLGVNTIKRPMSLSQDDSSSESAIKNVLENLNFNVKNIIFTSYKPLRKPKDIDNAFKKMVNTNRTHFFLSCEDYFDIWEKKKNKYIPLTIDLKIENQDNF